MKRASSYAMGLLCAMLTIPAFGQDVHIVSVDDLDARIPIAVPPFAAVSPDLVPIAEEMAEVIAFDLDFSGMFIILDEQDYPENFRGLEPDVARLDREAWRATRAEHLVYGVLQQEGDQLVAQFRLFDLFSMDQIVGQELRVDRQHPRLAAHRFSEEVIRYLTGTPGIGTTEIVFSAGPMGEKELYIADYDGANVRQITRHGSISIMPKLSPDGNRIAYLSYKDRYSFLYIYDRRDGVSAPLSREVGLNAAPAWAPNGEYLAMTLSKDGNSEIYFRNPDGSNLRRITRNRDSDTSPSFSPDGSQIAFVSDRGGNAQIYMMNSDGGNERRISFQGGSSYDPAWSPCGRYFAYVVERRGEGLEIYMMDSDGSNPRRLTDSHGINESPNWSPDSRHIIFTTTRSGSPRLHTINVETGEDRPIARLANMRTEGGTWGPRRR